jgi:hypothetical protein
MRLWRRLFEAAGRATDGAGVTTSNLKGMKFLNSNLRGQASCTELVKRMFLLIWHGGCLSMLPLTRLKYKSGVVMLKKDLREAPANELLR